MIGETEVAIVGGSLAGAALASHLGRFGIACTIFDKAEFPREKACGEGLSRAGRLRLEALGVRDRLGHPACAEIGGFLFDYDALGDFVRIPLPEQLRVTPVRRRDLDHALLESARSFPDVAVRTGEKVRAAHFDGTSWTLVCGGASLRAGVLALADGGNGSLLSETVDVSEGTEDYGCTFHLQSVHPHGVTSVIVITAGPVHAYCTPVEPTVLNVSVLGRRGVLGDFLRRAQHKRLFARIESKIGWRGSQEAAPAGRGPFGSRRSIASGDPVLLVGDRLECLHPIGGMGMTYALISAEAAARAIREYLREGAAWTAASRHYVSEMSRKALPLRTFTSIASRITKHRRLGEALSACARGVEWVSKGSISKESGEIVPAAHAIAGPGQK